MKVFEKLRQKIRLDLGIDVHHIKRTYAGRNMQASGAHKWKGTVIGDNCEVGSYYTASELAKATKLTIVDGFPAGCSFTDKEIIPVKP